MLKVILTRGASGSGKTTWALDMLKKHPGMYKHVCKDDLRTMLDGGRWSKANERFIIQARDALILAALAAGYHVIVGDTNLVSTHEEHIRELVAGKALVGIKDFTDVPLETCIERDLARPRSVGERVIRGMYRKFIQPPASAPKYDHSLKDAIICDLDGTLALLNGRDPYNASTCESDRINEPIADIVAEFANEHCTILFTSGRSEEYREQTLRWLRRFGFNETYRPILLFMRAAGDNRQDAIVKEEIYREHIEGRYNVKFVLDDRSSVIALWRRLGLVALQVAEGDF